MSLPRIAFALVLAVAIVGSAGRAALAGAFEVAPTTVNLSAKARTAVVRITNRGAQAVTIRVRPYDWRQSGDKDALTPSTVLVASPLMARLAPGGRQVVRLRELGPALEPGEQAHRLLVSEVESGNAAGAGEVRMLLQFSLPVFGPARAPGSGRLSWDARVAGGQLILTAANAGSRHIKLVKLAVTSDGAPGQRQVAAMVYVLAGASRHWRVPLRGLSPAAGLMLRAEDGATGEPLAWRLKVRRWGEAAAGEDPSETSGAEASVR